MITFQKLRTGWIVGIIDSYGAVHSKFINLKDGIKSHDELFPMRYFKCWRWNFNNCFRLSILSEPLDVEDWDKIQRHITRQYGIQWNETGGWHDLDHFNNQLKLEKKGA